jgi:hypothetical protein
MLKTKGGFDPLFEALRKSRSDNIVIGWSLHLPSENLGIDPLNNQVQSSSDQFQIGHQTSYVHALRQRSIRRYKRAVGFLR